MVTSGHEAVLQFRKWLSHNRRALKDVALKRRDRTVPLNAPLSLAKVIVTTHLDAQFADFAARVGGPVAETYFLRALQYAADHDGAAGAVRCPRASFGPIVLSRPWHVVSKATGEKVFDALLASNICILSADTSVDLSTLLPADKSKDLSRPPSPSPSVPSLPPATAGAERPAPRQPLVPNPNHALGLARARAALRGRPLDADAGQG